MKEGKKGQAVRWRVKKQKAWESLEKEYTDDHLEGGGGGKSLEVV